jgi:hypothetical protein
MASSVQSGLAFSAATRRMIAPASAFFLRKPLEVGDTEGCKIVGIAPARFPSPMQMALEQTSTAVRRIDFAMPRAVDGPRRIDRPS